MKLLYLSDADLKGSGYLNLSIPLLGGLVGRGWDVKEIGLGYDGGEHNYPFSILPVANFAQSNTALYNLNHLWKPDVLCVSLDIPLQINIMRFMQQNQVHLPYVGIFPVEGDPLCLSWAMQLMAMQASLCISKFGTEECNKVHLPTQYLPIGVDTMSWKMPNEIERKTIRESMGIEPDEFVILCVADNQERKNLSRTLEIIKRFSEDTKKKFKFWLITREHNSSGYELRDYAGELGINNHVWIFERGMPFNQLWSFYAGADCFLLTSKSEGLGMPVLEAMSVGLPVVGTDCTGIHEHLYPDKGYLITPEYIMRDPWGNSRRYMADAEHANFLLSQVYFDWQEHKFPTRSAARKYVEDRHWSESVDVLENTIRKVLDEQAKAQLLSDKTAVLS
jgi:glycosyltransferase involved in cell wall biosynthesis